MGLLDDLKKEADTLRDADLNELGFTTLRFTNEEVIGKLDHVLKSIKDKADDLKLSSVEKRHFAPAKR